MKHTPHGLSDIAVTRLLDACERLPRDIRADQFDMYKYRATDDQNAVCKTIACFAGHMTRYAKDWGVKILRTDRVIDFNRFLKDALGIDVLIEDGDEIWEWLFSSAWGYTDNTLEGAILRCRYLIENGLPNNWRKQMRGKEPLCYRSIPDA